MKLLYIFQVICLVFLLNSCNNSKLEKCTLENKGKYSLPLQKNTALSNIEKIAINNINDSIYISFLDNSTRTIFVYSFLEKKLIRSVKIQIEKFNITYSSYLIHNLDSIFILDYLNSDLYLINLSGISLKKIKIRSTQLLSENNKNQNYFIPFPTDGLNSNGFYFVNDKVYLSSSGNESVDYSPKCKDVFQVDLNKDTSNLVFQKPSHYLIDEEKSEVEQYDFLNGYYFGLYFDSYQNKYYRFVNMPIRKNDYIESINTGVFKQKIAMVVSDENFNIINDFELSEIYKCPIFINNGMFYFLDRESYRNNSDSLYLSIYSIKQ